MTLEQRFQIQFGELIVANLNLLQQVEDITKQRDEAHARVVELEEMSDPKKPLPGMD